MNISARPSPSPLPPVSTAAVLPGTTSDPAPGSASRSRAGRFHALVRASGGPRYAVALAVDALGTGLLRPFLLLYGILVLRLPAQAAGLAMTVGIVAGLAGTPVMGRWLDRGARSTAVAAAMVVRVAGTVLLLAAPAGSPGTVWLFAGAALVLGIGNQAFPVAHAALVVTVAEDRERGAALAAGRSLRNAGVGLGALLATACLSGGAPAMRVLAAGTGLSYLAAAALAWSVRVRAHPTNPAGPFRSHSSGPGPRARAGSVPRMRLLLAANVVYAFCLNVPEVALPLVLVTYLDASPVWAAVVLVTNTVLVVTLQVPVTAWMSRYPRRTALVISGIVLSVSYLGFLACVEFGHGWTAPAVTGVSVLCTVGEIIYAGSSTPLIADLAAPRVLGRALARFQLSTGLGLAVSPAVITALASHGPTALWATLTAATLLAAAAVRR
ncbi:MAG: MFS transporter [Mycobacteriales bacterium]